MSGKSYDHPCNNTLKRTITSLTTSVSAMPFHFEIMFTLNAIKLHFKGSNDIQNLTYVVILNEIHETCQRLVSYISYEMTTSVRASMLPTVDTFRTVDTCLPLIVKLDELVSCCERKKNSRKGIFHLIL